MRARLNELTRHHYENCPEYRKILDAMKYDISIDHEIADIPMLPARLFKHLDLKSTKEECKVVYSSGTTGNRSRIYLDAETSKAQRDAFLDIATEHIGKERRPILFLDDDQRQNAWLPLASKIYQPWNAPKGFDGLIVGTTLSAWKLYNKTDGSTDFSGATLVHNGGWKNIPPQAWDLKKIGIPTVHSYYGITEQLGSVFWQFEGAPGNYKKNSYCDFLIRSSDLSIANAFTDDGIIQVFSVLPKSYPGHSILTEDIGTDIGGAFTFNRRAIGSETRGCGG